MNVAEQVVRLPAVGHTTVLVFSSSLTGTVRLFCSHLSRINISLYVSIVTVNLDDHVVGEGEANPISHNISKVLDYVILASKLTIELSQKDRQEAR